MNKRTEQIQVENINHPGKLRSVDQAKYRNMRTALLAVVPMSPKGITLDDISRKILSKLSQTHFPEGQHAGWWLKTVQLDLEAKKLLVRSKPSPIKLSRVT